MDGNGKKPRRGTKHAKPAPAAEATQQPAARGALEETPVLSDGSASASAAQLADDAQPVASVDESRGGAGGDEEDNNRGGGGDDDDDDDEQVERFYALLANIRAMRGLLPLPHNMVASSSACAGGGDTDTAGDSTRKKKRLRLSAAEPPWRPVFRIEDFEEPAPAPTAAACKTMRKRTRGAAGHDDHDSHGESGVSSARPPAVAVVASSSLDAHAAVRFQQ